jgi:signal transduction histidine kinase
MRERPVRVHPERMHRVTAAAAALVGIAGEGVAIALAQTESARWNELAVAADIVAYAAVGLLIVWHRPGHRIGTTALAMVCLWGPGQALVAHAAVLLHEDPGNRAAALESVVGSTLRGLPWLVLVLWLPLIFPDGAPPDDTRLRRTAARLVAVTLAGFTVVSLFSPTLTDLRFDTVDSPIGLPHSLSTALGGLAGLCLLLGLACLVLVVACLVQQYRRGGPLGRQQTLTFAIAFIPPLFAFAASATDSAGPWLFGLSTLPVPVAIGVAVLQRRLYDLPLALNRSLTYGGLWLLIALLYAVTVGGVGALVRDEGAPWLPWVAAGVVAVSFAPLRNALQRGANRVTYGQWASPEEVRARTSRRIAEAGELGSVLDALVHDLAEGLGLGCVQITDLDGATIATAGNPTTELDELPLMAYGVPVGSLRWTRRPLREVDRALLAELAGQLGAVVHAGGLTASVRRAQERLVLAREEERRRLRRDLHDGLGPALAGLSLQVDTVRNTIGAGPEAEASLLGLRSGIQDTVLDVRRIVEGLRPPALDDLGLVEAVQQLTDASPLPARVEADPLPRLPAAVEVAAYRIVQEALTNAARHADARSAIVSLHRTEGNLVVEVVDDGSGRVTPRPGGVGLGSMRERAEEIGGSFTLLSEPGHGTRVHVALPVEEAPDA